MQINYYFLKFLTEELQTLVGYTLFDVHYQNRSETFFQFFTNDKEFTLKLTNYSDFTCLSFPKEYSKNKKATHSIFKPIQNKKIIKINQHVNDRSFSIVFENEHTLLFKLHGSRSNLILFSENKPIELLIKNLSYDTLIDLSKLDKPTIQTIENFISEEENIHKLFPAFDKTILQKIQFPNYARLTPEEKWNSILKIKTDLNQKKFYISQENETIQLSFFQSKNDTYQCFSALEASNYYENLFSRNYYHGKLQKEIISKIEKDLKKTISYIKTLESKLTELENQFPYSQIADILMANLHQIPLHIDQITLTNFYTESEIKIKLNKLLSPQKNAENYYRKGKNKKIEVEEIKKNCAHKKIRLAQLQQQLTEISSSEQLKELKKTIKDNNLSEIKKTAKGPTLDSLFKKFIIDGFEVLVGKNAKNNDILTKNYSFKEDLWLHARDVAGSHVLIKYKSGNPFTKKVIEKAAQLAAYYSKRKSDSLCPVIVTPKKYVRKPKNAKEGEVIVDREEVILVKPSNFDNLDS